MTATAPLPSEAWAKWFFRLVQFVGLGVGVHESLGDGRPFVLLFAGALILGAIGLRALLRGAVQVIDPAAKEQEQHEPR